MKPGVPSEDERTEHKESMRVNDDGLTATLVTTRGYIVKGKCEDWRIYLSMNNKHNPLADSTQVLYLKHTDGLRKPTGPFPIASRASLIRVIIDPTTGEEQEVPKTSSNSPSIPVRGRKNMLNTSGPGKEHTNDVVRTCLSF